MKTWRGKAAAAGVLLLLGLAVLWTRDRSPVPILWTARAPLAAWAPAVSDDGTVYVNGPGVVRAYDSSGKLKWRSAAGIFDYSNPVLGRDGTVYLYEGRGGYPAGYPGASDVIGTNEGIVALRPDGSVKWRFAITNIYAQPLTGAAFSVDGRGTLYFTINETSPKTLMAVGSDGKERWRFQLKDQWSELVQIDGDREFLLSGGTNDSHLLSFDAEGRPGRELAFPGSVGSFSFGTDGAIYVPALRGATLTAISATASNLWEFKSDLGAIGAPTVGPDGSLYFVAGRKTGGYVLAALSKSGERKWEFALSEHLNPDPPVVASDGTLFLSSRDPKLMALNPDGTLRWTFVPQKHIRWRLPQNWGDFVRQLKEDFGNVNAFATPPTLTTNGILYIAFYGPYDRLYALDVGVGLATNSPWPMKSGNPRLTREVAPPMTRTETR